MKRLPTELALIEAVRPRETPYQRERRLATEPAQADRLSDATRRLAEANDRLEALLRAKGWLR